MQVRVDRVRMAMPGCFYSYDVTVPLKDGDDRSYIIVRDGKEYLTFTDATLPAEHRAMPLGWERYTAYQAHETMARINEWSIICTVFPEVGEYKSHTLFMEIPGFDAPHDTKMLEWSKI